MYHISLAVHCIYGWSDEGGEDGDGKKGCELPGGLERMEIAWPLYADDMVLCGKLEKDLKMMVGWFA